MTKYPIEVDQELWDLFKGTIPSGEKINVTFKKFVRDRVRDTYSAEAIENNPQFGERHLEYFNEHLSE